MIVMTNNRPMPTHDEIAAAFANVLSGWLTEEQWAEMQALNAIEPAGSDICHSHDFCDANMAMHEAMASLGVDVDRDWAGDDEMCALWNASWDHARKNHLS